MGFEWVYEVRGMRLFSIHWESEGTKRSQAIKYLLFNKWTVTTIPVIFRYLYINVCTHKSVLLEIA